MVKRWSCLPLRLSELHESNSEAINEYARGELICSVLSEFSSLNAVSSSRSRVEFAFHGIC